MYVNCFKYNNKYYDYGTIIKAKIQNKETKITFISYNTESKKYLFKINAYNYKDGYYLVSYTEQEFKNSIIEVTDMIDIKYVQWHPLQDNSTANKLTFMDELKVDGLFIAWLWYIFLMGITFIFIGRIFYWTVISLGFFIYRYGKLKEEGYK